MQVPPGGGGGGGFLRGREQASSSSSGMQAFLEQHNTTLSTPQPPTPGLLATLFRLLQEESIVEVAYSYREQTAYLATLYTLLVIGIGWFLMRYANRSLFRWHTWINISVSYFCAIGILVLIPLDLAVTKLSR